MEVVATLDELASIQPGLGTVMLEYSRWYWIIRYRLPERAPDFLDINP
ncbi:MAG: hypothetical protein AABX40_01415 [Candidatus Hydrothermarchaeota archaeon]